MGLFLLAVSGVSDLGDDCCHCFRRKVKREEGRKAVAEVFVLGYAAVIFSFRQECKRTGLKSQRVALYYLAFFG